MGLTGLAPKGAVLRSGGSRLQDPTREVTDQLGADVIGGALKAVEGRRCRPEAQKEVGDAAAEEVALLEVTAAPAVATISF